MSLISAHGKARRISKVMATELQASQDYIGRRKSRRKEGRKKKARKNQIKRSKSASQKILSANVLANISTCILLCSQASFQLEDIIHNQSWSAPGVVKPAEAAEHLFCLIHTYLPKILRQQIKIELCLCALPQSFSACVLSLRRSQPHPCVHPCVKSCQSLFSLSGPRGRLYFEMESHTVLPG